MDISILSNQDTMKVSIYVPLVGKQNINYGETIFIDSMPFVKGNFELAFTNWKPNDEAKTISMANEYIGWIKLGRPHIGDFTNAEIKTIFNRKYFNVSLKDKGVIWKKLDK